MNLKGTAKSCSRSTKKKWSSFGEKRPFATVSHDVLFKNTLI